MTQNVLDYSQNPSGSELMDNYLAGMAENQLTSHSGVQRPSYAQAGTFWIDISVTPWVLKQFTGSADIIVGTLDQTNSIFISDRALGDKNGDDITTTYAKKSASNTFTQRNTFSQLITGDKGITVNGNNATFNTTTTTFTGNTKFEGSSNLFSLVTLKKQTSGTTNGGRIVFQANTDDPSQADMEIIRRNGKFDFSGFTSDNVATTPFSVDIENQTVLFNKKGQSLIAKLGMPSVKYTELTLGASGSSYTVPANGYFFFAKHCLANQYIFLTNNTSSLRSRSVAPIESDMEIWLPCKKGDTVVIAYSASGNTMYFRFVYAEGDKT